MKHFFFLTSLLLLPLALSSDEGMWTLNSLPKEKIEKKYEVVLDDQWVEHVQKSCLRVSAGGSASFVSSRGLVMTNHHVASKAIFNLSTEQCDFMKEGFYASSNDKELKCPNLYVDQLMEIQDVTEEIASYLSPDMTTMEMEKARKEAIAAIKERAQEETGLQPEIVTLYLGARHHLYLYKRYSDIRLVMCPEEGIANFGGDPDNFEFPRYCLDMTFFRVYENDEPLPSEHYLKWSQQGAKVGEALFVLGHPGGTDRILTSDHLSFLRDVSYPMILQCFEERLACFRGYGEKSEEHSRIVAQDEMSLSNALKVYRGMAKGLNDGTIITHKETFESDLFKELSSSQQKPWEAMKQVLDETKAYFDDYFFLEAFGSRFCKTYNWAKLLVRIADESEKPNGKRLKGYSDSELPTLKLSLLTTEPVYLDYEKALLVDALQRAERNLGTKHPAIQAALQGKTIEALVESIFEQTQLHDLQYREFLYQNKDGIENSPDPLIHLVKAIEPYARELREEMDNNLLAVQTDSYAKITQLLFKKEGQALYPDATFTLRLSTGSMVDNPDQDHVSPFTVIDGLFDRAQKYAEKPPYSLPQRWKERKSALDPEVPFNFVSTNDITGGNSGSPVINAQREVVGLIFDGNAHTFTWDFAFDQEQGRAVSVHSEIIRYALKEIYHAEELLGEMSL